MGNLGHQAARLAASKICDNIVKGLCKDPETEVVKLIDMWQKFMGDEKIDLNYDSARKMICDKDCTLNKYMNSCGGRLGSFPFLLLRFPHAFAGFPALSALQAVSVHFQICRYG